MNITSELLLEGSYLYFQKDANFSQENFKLVHLQELGQFHIYAEILSRVETGEFLKILVRFEMTSHFIPYLVRIEKSIGSRSALEVYKVDLHTQELFYTFESGGASHEFKRAHSLKHYLTSPAFSTSVMWTLSRKMDATGRTAVTLVSSQNDWTYQAPPSDKIVFAEFKSRELEDYKLNNTPLSAAHLCLYEHDSIATVNEVPVDIYISKHFAIPYQLVQGDLRIDIKNLKKHA